MLDLAIIILHHNTPDFVHENLKKLQIAILPEKTKIVVVDNGERNANSNLKSQKYKNLDIQFLDTPNHGFPTGNNFGAKNIDAKYYAFINPDIEVEKDTIQLLLTHLKKHSHVGIVAPQLVYADGTIQDNYRVFPRVTDLAIKRIPFLLKKFPDRMRQYLMWDRDPNSTEAVDWVTGAFTILTKECFLAINGHDQRYFLFMSDVVLCREAYKKGFETHIVGSAKALHNDTRVSSGGIQDIFSKKIIRLHILDALKYFLHYLFEPLPKNSPSKRR